MAHARRLHAAAGPSRQATHETHPQCVQIMCHIVTTGIHIQLLERDWLDGPLIACFDHVIGEARKACRDRCRLATSSTSPDSLLKFHIRDLPCGNAENLSQQGSSSG